MSTTAKPKRIQRKRTKGWRMPEGAVYVGRPTKWGNPWSSKNGTHIVLLKGQVQSSRPMTKAECVDAYREDVLKGEFGYTVKEIRRELAGKDLVCWCAPGEVCHADVLIELANGRHK